MVLGHSFVHPNWSLPKWNSSPYDPAGPGYAPILYALYTGDLKLRGPEYT